MPSRFKHSTDVATLLFPKGTWTPAKALAWARAKGFHGGKVDAGGEKAKMLRVRQHLASSYQPGTFRTITLGDGVEAVVAVPKRGKAGRANPRNPLTFPTFYLRTEDALGHVDAERAGFFHTRDAAADAADALAAKWRKTGRRIFFHVREIPPARAALMHGSKRANPRNPLAFPGTFEEHKPRGGYLPKHLRGTLPNVDPGETDLSIWAWAEDGRHYAVAFQGRAAKPLWYHRFASAEGMREHIRKTIAARAGWLDRKEATAKARKAFQPSVKVGNIYYTSGGYDETHVSFFQVVRVSGKAADVQPVAGKIVSSERGADYVAAVPGKFAGPAKRVILTEHGFKVGHQYASPWDGRPKYETAAGWGH